MYHDYEEQLQSLAAIHQRRSLPQYIPIDSCHVLYQGVPHLMMASNNYLGLTFHPYVQEASKEALERYGTGSSGSRLTSGSHPLFQTFESSIANWKECEAALTFTSGYMANVGTITALLQVKDAIFSDALNHASLIDGCRLSGATIHVYPHKDMRYLEQLLRQSMHTPRRLIVTDGVFSMDGDIAPLDELIWLAETYDAFLLVDDAHATGVIGQGRGTAHHFQIQSPRLITTGTMSKALGAIGGFVCGSTTLIDYIINHSRPFIFATALSPADMGAAIAALEIIQQDSSFIQTLQNNIHRMSQNLNHIGVTNDTITPIFPIIVGANVATMKAAQLLEKEHIIMTAIRPPTVPQGSSRLRLTVTANHTYQELDRVSQVLKIALQS